MRSLVAFATALLLAANVSADLIKTDATASAVGFLPDTEMPSSARVPAAAKSGDSVADFSAIHYDFSRPMRVGFQKELLFFVHGPAVSSTRTQLEKLFGRKNVEFYGYSRTDLHAEINAGRLDFIISAADFYSTDEVSQGLRAIASLWPLEAADPLDATGAVYFQRRGDHELTVADLAGKSIAALSPDNFGGWLSAQRDMLMRGLVPASVLEGASFYGPQPIDVAAAVVEGRAQAGVLPACELEKLYSRKEIDPNKIEFIGRRSGELLNCAYSTELYPSYYFAAVRNADPALVKAVSAALFTMSSMGDGSEWGLPVSNRGVSDLLFDLKLGPYANKGSVTFVQFMRQNRVTFMLIGVILLLVLSYSFMVSILVRRRTAQLREALADRERIEKLAEASRDHIAKLERTGIVGQISSMIAHELKQPLGAITNYANSLVRRLRRGAVEPTTLNDALKEIVEQSERASEIVNRVRSYAKSPSPTLKHSDMSYSVNNAIETFVRSRRTEATMHVNVPVPLWADIDDWEIELAVLNLLKNAADALQGLPNQQIWINVKPEDRYWRVAVRDNGLKITQEKVNLFMEPLFTSKESGLGLGLSIVCNIAERHHGRVVGFANEDQGVTICLDIPRAERPEDTAI